MKICQQIGCPHPNQLEQFGIGYGEFYDWYGYFLWDQADEDYDDGDRIAYLEQYKRESAG